MCGLISSPLAGVAEDRPVCTLLTLPTSLFLFQTFLPIDSVKTLPVVISTHMAGDCPPGPLERAPFKRGPGVRPPWVCAHSSLYSLCPLEVITSPTLAFLICWGWWGHCQDQNAQQHPWHTQTRPSLLAIVGTLHFCLMLNFCFISLKLKINNAPPSKAHMQKTITKMHENKSLLTLQTLVAQLLLGSSSSFTSWFCP